MDISAQWPHQDIVGVVKPMNDHHQEMVVNSNMNTCSSRPTTTTSTSSMLERKAISRPQKEQVLNCPRCNSTNTKFCYYNNYSLTQPRYFCKTCRRYWTEGGSLRNVPVGGGSRKNKRSSSSSTSSPSPSSTSTTTTTSSKKLASSTHDQNPKIIEAQDLNLAYPNIRHEYLDHHQFNDPSPTSTTTTSSLSALELLRTGMSSTNSSRGLINSFMPMPSTQQPHHDPNTTTVYSSSGFGLQDFKPTLNFGLDGLGSSGYGNSTTTTTLQEVHDHNVNGRPISFPFEDLKQVSSTSHDDDHHQFEQNRSGLVPLQGSTTTTTHDTNGYWNGMLSGGSW